MKIFSFFAAFAGTSFVLPTFAQSTTNGSTVARTTLSSTTITSTQTGPVTIPQANSTTINGTPTVTLTAPTGPVTPIQTVPVVQYEYTLRVRTLDGYKRYECQYLASWQILAGYVNDAVFTKNKTLAAKFYLNGTQEMMDIGTVGKPWSMNIEIDSMDARWYRVTMNSPFNNGFGAFWVNQTGLQWTPNETAPPHLTGSVSSLDNYFAGWVVCDWWHGAPQLFYKVGLLYSPTVLPDICADVNLYPEYFGTYEACTNISQA